MKRIYYMIFRNLLVFPYLYFKLLYLAKSKKATWNEKYSHLRKITDCANKGGCVNVIGSGMENIPEKDGYILFPNHQGMYDVLTLIATNEHPFSVVMKKELENIPLLKQVFRAMGALAIDRNDIKQSLKVILQVAKEVQNGKNFLIFAEGTRSKEGNKPGEFKGGSFKSAIKAKCPIVPVALVDAYKPFDESSIQPVTVQVAYLKPIQYEEYKDMTTTEIGQMVRSQIVDKIQELISQE